VCTLTWFVKATGYELFFNRDERKSRSRAIAPKKFQQKTIHYLSPIDTDAGGTWIATNHFGITVCLLNYYQYEHKDLNQNWISRGELVKDFASTSNLRQATEDFEALDLSHYRAFRLFMIDNKGSNRLFVWNGNQLHIEENINTAKTSSSVNTQEVKVSRYGLYHDLCLSDSTSSKDFINFHASHLPNKSAQSVCMHREDANTVSFSHIDVSAGTASFSYADGPPCTAKLQQAIVLDLI